jgi:hypothetical protein
MRKFWKGTGQRGLWKFWKDLLRPSFFRIRVKAFSYGSPIESVRFYNSLVCTLWRSFSGVISQCCASIQGAIWEPDGNPLGTWREHIGNKRKMKKIPPAPHLPKLQREKHFRVHAEPSHWLHEIFISKTVCHHFWPGWYPHYKPGLLILVWVYSVSLSTCWKFIFIFSLMRGIVPSWMEFNFGGEVKWH